MWILRLNNMLSAQCQDMTTVCRAETKEELQALLDREKVELYYEKDGKNAYGDPVTWSKSYRKGGPLEWFNPPTYDEESFVDVGTADEWANNARNNFELQVMGLPAVEDFQ